MGLALRSATLAPIASALAVISLTAGAWAVGDHGSHGGVLPPFPPSPRPTYEPQPVRPVTWRPLPPTYPQVADDFAYVAGTSAVLQRAVVGKPLNFVVSLASVAGPVVLTTCPDYTVTQRLGGHVTRHRYALDCSHMPYRNKRGLPYLPQRLPVSFQMRLPSYAGEDQHNTWTLDVPEPIRLDVVQRF
jgi:hypothetical protein